MVRVLPCNACGHDVPNDARFCPQCGAAVTGSAAEDQDESRDSSKLPPEGERATDEPREQFSATADRRESKDDPERELWQGHYSPRATIPQWIGAAVVTVVALIGGLMLPLPAWAWWILMVLVLILWIGIAVRLLYLRLNDKYTLTTQRFIHERGILRRVTDRVEVIDIDDVTFSQGIIERMIGVGTIQLSSSDRTHPELWLRGIEGVGAVANEIDGARRKERVRRGLHIEAV